MDVKLNSKKITRQMHPWYLYKMIILNMLRTYEIFSKKKVGFDDSVDVTKCPQLIEIPELLHMCAPCSELPSNKSTMDAPETFFVISNTIYLAKEKKRFVTSSEQILYLYFPY